MNHIADQYRTIRETAGWIDRSRRGRLRFEGADAISFLQALVSNDIARMAPGDGAYATYLTPQGRMIADLELYQRHDGLLADVAPGLSARLAERFDQLIFTEDVRVSDVSGSLAEILIVGGGAAAILGRALGMDADALASLPELGQLAWPQGFVARSGDAPIDAFKIFVPAEAFGDVVQKLEVVGVRSMTEELAEALRIAAGRPAFGIDMTEETIPLEAGLLDRAISTTKGCYVGQEIIIRILHRGGGRVAKRLVTLAWVSTGDPPARGAAFFADGRQVGQLTSVAPELSGDGLVGLGYVSRDLATIGQTLTIGEATGAVARVTGLAR